MIGWTVSFWLAPSPKLPPREQKKWDKEIYRVIKPLVDSCTTLGDCEIDLDSPNLPELVGYFEDLRKKNVACLGCPEFKQRLMDDEHSRIEWFILDPKDQGEFDFSFDDLPTCKADRFKPGMDVAGFRTQLVVTERFKAVVEAHKLTGVEFVWMKDRSKYRAPQWYLPIAHEPLGRGLDHPWFDSTKMSGHGHASKDPRFRCGEEIVTSLGGYTLKSDAAFGDPVKDKLLALAKSMSDHRIERAKPVPRIVILACPIFLRDYLPETDFAFTLEGFLRGLACNRKTKDLLVANRLVTEAECAGVVVLDKPYKGAEVLDRKYGRPEPLFSAEKLEQLRAKETQAWAEFVRNPKPVRARSLPRALALLRVRKRNQPQDFAPPARAKAIAEAAETLGRHIPEAWQKVLRISNGGEVKNCELACGHGCSFVKVEELAEKRRREAASYRRMGAKIPDTSLFVMLTQIGDSIWLDTATDKPNGDCRVLLMSHETGEEEREWSSVADFLEELLTAQEG